MSEAILEVCGLTCERGERTLFRNLSFAVKPGTLVRIAGSNGAGKTTLLRLMTGLMRPVEGEVRWRGVPVEKAAGHIGVGRGDRAAPPVVIISRRRLEAGHEKHGGRQQANDTLIHRLSPFSGE